jgi:hypothetical protein
MQDQASQLAVQQQHQQAQQQCSIFFAGACPLASSEELLTLFAQFGRVMEINLYRPYKHCKASKVNVNYMQAIVPILCSQHIRIDDSCSVGPDPNGHCSALAVAALHWL